MHVLSIIFYTDKKLCKVGLRKVDIFRYYPIYVPARNTGSFLHESKDQCVKVTYTKFYQNPSVGKFSRTV